MTTNYEGKKILKKRLRDENNVPYGMVVALNKNQLGYSVCHSKLDKYKDVTAFNIAKGRAESFEKTNAKFWIKKRRNELKENPMYTYDSDFIKYIPITKKVFDEQFKFEFSNFREITALRELKLMQERAKRYFKN